MYGKLGNSANFRIPVFDGFTRFGDLKNPKITKLAWCPGVR